MGRDDAGLLPPLDDNTPVVDVDAAGDAVNCDTTVRPCVCIKRCLPWSLVDRIITTIAIATIAKTSICRKRIRVIF